MPYKDPNDPRKSLNCAAANKRWREAHPEQVAEYRSEYTTANADELRRRHREWKRNNPDKCRVQNQRRRARKLNQFIEDVDPQVLYQMHGGMCGICEEFIEGDFHVDHVIPLSKGGMHGYVNTQPAHPICNTRKGNRV